MWILILIVLAVVVYFVMSQASSTNQSSKASSTNQSSKASSQNYTNQVDYSNLEVSLESDVLGQDYTHLRDLLAEGKWKEADKETGRMMLLVGMILMKRQIRDGEYKGSSREDCLAITNFRFLPCKDLCTIDRLWLKYSNGRFGFSVQKRIVSEIGDDALSILVSSEQFNNKSFEIGNTLERRIGWYTPRDDKAYGRKIYNDLTFSIQAPYGHLPTANYCCEGSSLSRKNVSFETEEVFGYQNLEAILNRLLSCGISL